MKIVIQDASVLIDMAEATLLDAWFGLSIEDVSALFFAGKLEGILLTGDKLLRQSAKERGIETHGLLWVFDTLVVRGALLPGVAADRLQKLIDSGTTRLPLHECELRIRKWRR